MKWFVGDTFQCVMDGQFDLTDSDTDNIEYTTACPHCLNIIPKYYFEDNILECEDCGHIFRSPRIRV